MTPTSPLDAIARACRLACSACLLGVRCRYDGATRTAPAPLLDALLRRPIVPLPQALERALLDLFDDARCLGTGHALHFGQIASPFLARGVLPICPELFGGLGCPRPAADFIGGDGEALTQSRARLVDRRGQDVSEAFARGARVALDLIQTNGATCALLKEGSPSCGVHRVQCDGVKIQGRGVAAAILGRTGIETFSEEDIVPPRA